MKHQGSARKMVTDALGLYFPKRKLEWEGEQAQWTFSTGPMRGLWLLVKATQAGVEVFLGNAKDKNTEKALYRYYMNDDGTENHDILQKDFRDLNLLVKVFVFAMVFVRCLAEVKWEKVGDDVVEGGVAVH